MKTPMLLQNIRVHGLGDVVDAPWIKVDAAITYFCLPDDFNRKGFLHALQSINPQFSLKSSEIFKNYPQVIRQGKYQKRVRPEKRTIAFAIFIAQPDFVKELAEITFHLYETDRVEVGRRLDYSRWVNFVEIASSTRWSEVKEAIVQLAGEYSDVISEDLKRELIHLKETDRVKDGLMESLSFWLQKLKARRIPERTDMLDRLLFDVNRQRDFKIAKALVRKRLPYFYIIKRDDSIKELRAHILSEEKKGNPPPVLLFDEHAFDLTISEKRNLRRFVVDISQSCQVIYLLEDDASGLPSASRVVSWVDMAA